MVKLRKEEGKVEIFRKKHRPKGAKIFVDDDLTRQEREVQKKIREKARKEKEKNTGQDIKMYRRYVRIGDKWCKWNDEKEQLEEEEVKAIEERKKGTEK